MTEPLDEFEFFFEKPWSDGLPVVAPTEARVERMLGGARRDPGELIGLIPPAMGECTVRDAAVHAVMAGCKPEYLPVVLAGLEAVLVEEFALNGIQATMHSCAPLLIVNGPYGKRIGLHGGSGCFGPCFRANATIGRALRLILLNLGAGIPGVVSMTTFSQPSRFTYCIRENEEESPWEPLSASRGLAPDQDAVTVVACENPKLVFDDMSREPEGILTAVADAMAHLGGMNALRKTDMVLAVGPEHGNVLKKAGWSREDVSGWLCKNAGRTLGQLKRGGGWHADRVSALPMKVDLADDGFFVPTIKDPGDLVILCAGGIPGPISAVMHGWNGASKNLTRAYQP